MPDARSERVVLVDLAGSNFPEALNAECVGAWPDEWSDDELRAKAAEHYAVPVEQTRIIPRPLPEPCDFCGRYWYSCDGDCVD